MWVRSSILACLLLLSPSLRAQQIVADFDHQHREYAEVLARVVGAGGVDYAALRRDRHLLDNYRARLAAVSETTLKTWTRDQQLAFWITAYNANVMATIINHYPITRGALIGLAFPANSIWQIPGAFKLARHRVAGRVRSLDNIEHDIVRPGFREPRVHMALVCAARGCPPLRAEPFVSSRLNAQLDDQTRVYLSDRDHGLRWDPGAKRIAISSIFKWFADDFAASGGARGFVARHLGDPVLAAAVRDTTNGLRYLDYDWTLNER
jgi:hypothetical protein